MTTTTHRSLLQSIAVLALMLLVISSCGASATAGPTPIESAPARSATSAPSAPSPAATEAAAVAAPTDAAVLPASPSLATAAAPASPAVAATVAPATSPATPVSIAAPSAAPAPTSAPPAATAVAAPAVVTVTLVDVAVRLDRSSALAGTVTFRIKNAGTVIHQLAVLKTDIAQGQIPVNPAQAATVLEPGLVAETPTLAPGASTTLTLTLGPGSYVLLCNQPAHYLIGMHTGFTVN